MVYLYLLLLNQLHDENGQSMHEYATILGLILVGCVGTLTVLGADVTDLYDSINQGINSSIHVRNWYAS